MKRYDAESRCGEDIAEVMGILGDALEGDAGGHQPPKRAPARDEITEHGCGGDGECDVTGGEGEIFLGEEAFNAAFERRGGEGGCAGFPVRPRASDGPFDDGVCAAEDACEEESPG